jgi:salicylate hydroxylase
LPSGEALEAIYGYAHYHLHRADLVAALAEAMPAERIHLGRRLVAFADHGDGATARRPASQVRRRDRTGVADA